MHDEIKSKLKSGNACYHSVQNLLSSSLLSKRIKIKIDRCNFAFLLCGHEAWYPTQRDEHTLRVFENRVLRNIFGPKRDKMTKSREDYTVLLTKYHLGDQIKNEMDRACGKYGG